MTQPRRILVVDDDEDIREVARLSLETVGGHTVLTASSGEQALEVAAAELPDAIVLDVMMPGLDGPSTFVRLSAQETTRHIPVVLLTAKIQTADRERYESLGVAAVFAKPFDPMALAGQLAAVLGWT
jgi:CheY-like chemotaxis protein